MLAIKYVFDMINDGIEIKHGDLHICDNQVELTLYDYNMPPQSYIILDDYFNYYRRKGIEYYSRVFNDNSKIEIILHRK